MKAEFTSNPDKDHILITPETHEEHLALRLWSGCVVEAEFTTCVTSSGDVPCLHICKGI